MPAYTPADARALAILIVALIGVLVLGHTAGRAAHESRFGALRALAWAALGAGTLGVDLLLASEPAGVRMVGLIAFAMLVMKTLVTVEERARGMPALGVAAWLAFAVGWLGMRPRPFAVVTRGALPGASALLRRGLTSCAVGAGLVLLARLAWVVAESRLLASLLLLPGLSLIVHFGLCNLVAATWRRRGVACDALFRAPHRSESLTEFWSRRWNVAFSEMAAIVVYRPFAARLGRGPALIAGFVLSGLLHEVAISLPVRAGFGLPLLYFVVHGVLVLGEGMAARSGRTLCGWRGRVWVWIWIVLPLPILFHQPFLAGAIWPLIGIPSQ